MEKSVQKYLAHYAELEAQEASFSLPANANWQNVIVIPARGEFQDLFRMLSSLKKAATKETLCLLIINNTANCSLSVKHPNRELWKALAVMLDQPSKKGPYLFGRIDSLSILAVDRSSPEREFPSKQGVGLARKIGFDIALQLWHLRRISRPWIFTTDADALLPKTYFEVEPKKESAALAYSFRHLTDDDPNILGYENWLYRYVFGLRYANSPYAHQSIGSTIAIHVRAYAQVRGFPKRLAGEDFYVLNKLAKLGEIETPLTPPILLSSRHSTRVPFGTGQALLSKRKLRHYPDQAFENLRAWLEISKESWRAKLEESALLLEGFSPEIALREIDERTQTEAAFKKQFHIWFDAFKTLKFLNRAADQINERNADQFSSEGNLEFHRMPLRASSQD